MQKPENNLLKDGDDSPAPSDKVKRQLLSDSLGICAAPGCDNRIDVQKTRLGECAHIIPKKVGSHPREDYTTSLENRAKEENLLYLCEKHHKIVDNKDHAEIYSADLLRAWKQDHLNWADGVTKTAPHIPKILRDGLSDLVKNFQQNVTNSSDTSKNIIGKLIQTCQELINRNFVSEAKTLLSQIELLLIDTEGNDFNCKVKTLNALLLVRAEQIAEAKVLLLDLINKFPTEIDPMLEYVELCDSFSESDDKKEKVESMVRVLDKDSPRLLLIDYSRMSKNQETPEASTIPENFGDDLRLNARLMCQKTLFCDIEGKLEERNELVEQWSNILPNSPRPHLFKVIYKTGDTFRNNPEKEQLEEALQFVIQERLKAEKKDPITIRDKISWRVQEMNLMLTKSQLFGKDYGLITIRDDLVNLIAQCYFDRFVDEILKGLLSSLIITQDQWLKIVARIQDSKFPVSEETSRMLFAQALEHEELAGELAQFIAFVKNETLDSLYSALREKASEKMAEILNKIDNPYFSLAVIHSINNSEFTIQLSSLINVEGNFQESLLYARIDALERSGRDEEALELIPLLPIEAATPSPLWNMLGIANRNQRWDIFIPLATHFIKLEDSPSRKTEIHAQLAFAYHQQGDDTSAIDHAEKALSNHETIGEKNSQSLLHVVGQALLLKGLADQACDTHEKYRNIRRSFPLLLEEADMLLKSSKKDKYERALLRIKQAFINETAYEDSTYLSAFMLLVELGNANQIPSENEDFIQEGSYVKLDGFRNGWFYIGPKEESMGAECIKKGTANYDALINKGLTDEVEWPADKFSGNGVSHKILHIVTYAAYLAIRSHEAMHNAAMVGNSPIWSIKVLDDAGSLDLENLKNFYQSQLSNGDEFFKTYTSTPAPFSFLCRAEGGLIQAIGRITSENKGFIFCNNGSLEDIEAQISRAAEALNGAPCVIDGLSSIVLAEFGILETVARNLPQLHVPTTVIRMLREVASKFHSSTGSEGRASFVNGNFQYRPIDKEVEKKLHEKLLSAANVFDSLCNKIITKDSSSSTQKNEFEEILPDYIVAPYRFAQEKNAFLITDDALILQAYKLSGDENTPKQFSSFSLIRSMANKELISWGQYLDFFSLLSSYRYHLLSITVDDMLRSILPSATSGLVTFYPKNLFKFNLRLTLSDEYGVNDGVAAGVLSLFFTKIILDDSITVQMAEEIFKITIVESLEKRNQRLLSKGIIQVCLNNMPNKNWAGQSVKLKFKALGEQLEQYVRMQSPIIL